MDLPTPSDPLFLGLYPACAIGLAILIRRRDPRRNWTAMVDATTITTGLGLLAWIYVIQPAAHGADMSILGRSVQVAYPIGDLLLLAMMTRLLRSGGLRGHRSGGSSVRWPLPRRRHRLGGAGHLASSARTSKRCSGYGAAST